MKKLADLKAPQEVKHKLLEKDIQKACVDWMRGRGYWARKFSSQSQRSVPDYLFRKMSFDCAVEFKAPRKTSTEAQLEEQAAMRAAGWLVFTDIDNVERFKELIQNYEWVFEHK